MIARIWPTIRTVGNVVAYVMLALLFCISALLGVGWAISAHEPSYWGTFTEHRCASEVRDGCQSVGTWTSEDRSIATDGTASRQARRTMAHGGASVAG